MRFRRTDAETLRALQKRVGGDFEKLVAAVQRAPVVVARASGAAEAQRHRQALEALGAEVTVERTATRPASLPPPLPASRPSPGRAGNPRSPRPPRSPASVKVSAPGTAQAVRSASQDLDFQLLGNDGRPQDHLRPRRSASAPITDARLSGRPLRRGDSDLELLTPELPSAALDVSVGASVKHAVSSPVGLPHRAVPSGPIDARPRGVVPMTAHGSRPLRAPSQPVSPKLEPPESRGWSLLRMAVSVLIAVVGLRLGNSVFHGNATLPSVLLHAFAIYQCGLGLRGLLR